MLSNITLRSVGMDLCFWGELSYAPQRVEDRKGTKWLSDLAFKMHLKVVILIIQPSAKNDNSIQRADWLLIILVLMNSACYMQMINHILFNCENSTIPSQLFIVEILL